MFIGNKESFNEYMDSIKILNPEEKTIYRVSLMYMLRSLLLILVLLIIIIYSLKSFIHPLEDNNLMSILLILFLLSYICFNIYTVFGYNIKVDKKAVENKKIKILISDIVKLKYILVRVNGKKYERVLSVITKNHKEYMFRLNIRKSFHFMKQLSILSNLMVEYID